MLERYEPAATFNEKLEDLKINASEIAFKWKMLRLALIHKYGFSFFRLPNICDPIDLSHFGRSSKLWEIWAYSSRIMRSTINGLQKIILLISLIEQVREEGPIVE